MPFLSFVGNWMEEQRFTPLNWRFNTGNHNQPFPKPSESKHQFSRKPLELGTDEINHLPLIGII